MVEYYPIMCLSYFLFHSCYPVIHSSIDEHLWDNSNNFLFFKFYLYLLYEYGCFACLNLHAIVCAVPKETRRGCWISWSWSYRWLLATIWMLAIESMDSALNHWAIFLAPWFSFSATFLMILIHWPGGQPPGTVTFCRKLLRGERLSVDQEEAYTFLPTFSHRGRQTLSF